MLTTKHVSVSAMRTCTPGRGFLLVYGCSNTANMTVPRKPVRMVTGMRGEDVLDVVDVVAAAAVAMVGCGKLKFWKLW